jgi:hypothetical protein
MVINEAAGDCGMRKICPAASRRGFFGQEIQKNLNFLRRGDPQLMLLRL